MRAPSPAAAHRLRALRSPSPSAARARAAGVDGADPSLFWADRANAGGAGGAAYARRDSLAGTSGVYALDLSTRQPIGAGHPAVLFSDLARSSRGYSAREPALGCRRARAGGDGGAATAENAGSFFSVAECNGARELLARKFERIAAELEAAGEARVPRRAPRPVPAKKRVR